MITLDEVQALQSNPELHLNTLLAVGVVCIKCGGRVSVRFPAPDAWPQVNYYHCFRCGPTGAVPQPEPMKLRVVK